MRPSLVLPALAAALSLTAAGTLAQGVSSGAPGQESAHITEIMSRLRDVASFRAVAVSPNGKQVAWLLDPRPPAAAGMGGEEERRGPSQVLQIADADGSHARTVTIGDAVPGCIEGDIAWSPDGRSLAFLSNCNHGERAGQLDVYVVGADGTQAHRVTHLDGFVHDLGWDSDGSHLSFLYVEGDLHPIAAVSPTKPRIGVIGSAGVEHQRVAMVSRDGGSVTEVTPESTFVYEYDWSRRGDRLTYVGAPPPGRDNWWVAKLYAQTPGGPPRVVVDPARVTGSLHGLQMALPRWSPDGSRIAFIGGLMSDQGATGGDIYVVPAAGGEPTDVTPGITITPSWLTWTGDRSLLVSSFAGGSARVSSFTLHGTSPATHQELFTVHTEISDGTAASSLSLSGGHDRLAFLHSTFDDPPEIYAATLRTDGAGQPVGVAQAPHAITDVNQGVGPMWGKEVSMHWTNEGFHVQGWLLFPAGYEPRKTYPLIVYVHGGPTYATRPRWPYDGYGPAPLAAMGYFVLMPNPRGSFGQGERFTKAVRKDMGYGDLRDILAGVDAVEAKYPINDKRLGITGWSYGGFMSMFAPTQTRRFKAAVVGAGLSDWKSYYGENSIDEWMIPFFGASVYQDPAVYAKSSAINFITHDKTPSLVLVGQYDGECPAPQSFEFWHALRAMHVPTELVVYAGEGHGFYKPQDRRNVLKRSLDWFNKYLGAG